MAFQESLIMWCSCDLMTQPLVDWINFHKAKLTQPNQTKSKTYLIEMWKKFNNSHFLITEVFPHWLIMFKLTESTWRGKSVRQYWRSIHWHITSIWTRAMQLMCYWSQYFGLLTILHTALEGSGTIFITVILPVSGIFV